MQIGVCLMVVAEMMRPYLMWYLRYSDLMGTIQNSSEVAFLYTTELPS